MPNGLAYNYNINWIYDEQARLEQYTSSSAFKTDTKAAMERLLTTGIGATVVADEKQHYSVILESPIASLPIMRLDLQQRQALVHKPSTSFMRTHLNRLLEAQGFTVVLTTKPILVRKTRRACPMLPLPVLAELDDTALFENAKAKLPEKAPYEHAERILFGDWSRVPF